MPSGTLRRLRDRRSPPPRDPADSYLIARGAVGVVVGMTVFGLAHGLIVTLAKCG